MYRFAQLRYIWAFVSFEKWPILMAAAVPWLVPVDMVEGMDVYVLGSSFTEDEKSKLAVLIVSLNGAAISRLCIADSHNLGSLVGYASTTVGVYLCRLVGTVGHTQNRSSCS